MKKKHLLILLIPLLTLTSCQSFDDLKAGEIPSGGKEIHFSDFSSFLNSDNDSKQKETKFKDCLVLDVKGDYIEYINEWTNYDEYDFELGEYRDITSTNIISLEDFKINLKAKGLAKSKKSDDLQVSFAASAYNSKNNLLSMQMFIQDSNLYASLNDGFIDIIESLGFTFPNQFYLKDIINDEMMPIFKNKDSNIPNNIQNSLIESIIDNFISINRYGLNFLITINLNRNNLCDSITSFLDDLYEKEVLDYHYSKDISLDEYQTIKDELIEKIDNFDDDFNHNKFSALINLSGIKKLLLDFDFAIKTIEGYTDSNNNFIYTYKEINSFRANLSFDIKLKNKVRIKRNDFSKYLQIKV